MDRYRCCSDMFIFDYSLKKNNIFKSSGNIKLKEIKPAGKVRVKRWEYSGPLYLQVPLLQIKLTVDQKSTELSEKALKSKTLAAHRQIFR